ncbi:MAG: pirin family protein, partial [SAR324 cluster bacterium]|nr:pirin family protein [SAR324 cluster bacterium]
HARFNQWLHLVSDLEGTGKIQIHQDFNLFASEIEEGKSLEFELKPSRQAYVLCLEGTLMVNQMILEKHEVVEIPPTSEISSITFSGQMGDEQTHLLLYEMSI